ncbi:SDR family oxidoreductase [Mesorhizobium sp. B2-6-2]|nr:SDR family oxidoreductase [Mesorhizobium sp. B2-6-2]
MSERVAIVTGAGRGLGRAMTMALLSAGHRVFLTSTDIESLDETRRASGAGERAAVKTADLGNEQELADLVDAAMRAFGRVDVLVSNAGVPNPPVQRPLDVTPDQFRQLFEINTLASINLIRHPRHGRAQMGSDHLHLHQPRCHARTGSCRVWNDQGGWRSIHRGSRNVASVDGRHGQRTFARRRSCNENGGRCCGPKGPASARNHGGARCVAGVG